jgi:hypothetical protein
MYVASSNAVISKSMVVNNIGNEIGDGNHFVELTGSNVTITETTFRNNNVNYYWYKPSLIDMLGRWYRYDKLTLSNIIIEQNTAVR